MAGFTNREWNFESQVESLDVSSDGRIVCCASNLEGNDWDGSLHILSLNNPESEISANSSAGCSSAKFIGPNDCKVITARDDGNIGAPSVEFHDTFSILDQLHILIFFHIRNIFCNKSKRSADNHRA